VTKVHLEVLRFAKDGYSILFVGHASHDEAVGTVGEAPQSITVVESPEDVQRVQVRDENKVAYVTQTTLSISDAMRVITALKKRFPNIKGPPKEDICYATTNRQAAVTALAPEVDLVLVIGSTNSSNSQRLVETARQLGKSAYLIDDQSGLRPEWFDGVESVLVTAGASAPEHLVDGLLDRLKRDFEGEVELRDVAREDVFFEPPRSLKKLAVVG
jgi:4-hydroxy-3-methylbut-2-en-1-yl diphosphate reductase